MPENALLTGLEKDIKRCKQSVQDAFLARMQGDLHAVREVAENSRAAQVTKAEDDLLAKLDLPDESTFDGKSEVLDGTREDVLADVDEWAASTSKRTRLLHITFPHCEHREHTCTSGRRHDRGHEMFGPARRFHVIAMGPPVSRVPTPDTRRWQC